MYVYHIYIYVYVCLDIYIGYNRTYH
jgi:hypothetical protein